MAQIFSGLISAVISVISGKYFSVDVRFLSESRMTRITRISRIKVVNAVC